MSEKRAAFFTPYLNWVRARLSRKLTVILVIVAVFGWLLSFLWFLYTFRNYAAVTYDAAMDRSLSQTQQVISFLAGSQGDFSGLDQYLQERELGCTIQDGDGVLLYQSAPQNWTAPTLTTSSAAPVTLASGRTLWVYVWSAAMSRQDLSNALGHQAFLALSLFNLSIFAAAGLLLYFLIVAPIIRLRRTMQNYSETGALPQRTARMDEVGKLQNTFSDLTGVLRAKEQSERRLIASISHDIKTPLTSILGYSERLLSAQLEEDKKRQYVRQIHDKGIAIKSIVDEFDDYLDAGLRDGTPMELMTARQLCDGVLEEYREELADTGVKLSVRCLCPQAKLIASRAHIRRYFGNLIANSINHGGREDLQLELLAHQEGHEIFLDFSDNGKGVAPELLQQIFEPLYTSDRGRKVSGLGLSICKSIIRAHGGAVCAHAAPQGGLTVRATLPLANEAGA
jgi:signal transduction histidine kinase